MQFYAVVPFPLSSQASLSVYFHLAPCTGSLNVKRILFGQDAKMLFVLELHVMPV